MKAVLIAVVLIGLVFLLIWAVGGKNLGNQPPVVPQKLLAQQTGPATQTTAGPIVAEQLCRDLIAAVERGESIDPQLDWLHLQFVKREQARVDAGLAGAATALPTRDAQRSALLAACQAAPDQSLAAVAEGILATPQ
jgi:hypothetical protein